jgi:UDP-N-acetylglucosamine 2-epimerase (non-hydrolysing)/GDP/UDP-N,N'-diacetylbacillosamine 2-epimerase (hydrolysing)
LGEEPWRVHDVGFPALDLITAGCYASPEQTRERFHLSPERPVLIFTQHSVATEYERAGEQVRPALDALVDAAEQWDCQVIVTYPNDDAGGRRIVRELERLAARKIPSVQIHRSLGRFYYHGVLNIAAACLGNSSSGIKETPAFRCPCIDIGPRQQGRLSADNVIRVGYDRDAISAAISTCLNDAEFRHVVDTCPNPYGAGNAGRQIADVLATTAITSRLIQKQMTY